MIGRHFLGVHVGQNCIISDYLILLFIRNQLFHSCRHLAMGLFDVMVPLHGVFQSVSGSTSAARAPSSSRAPW